MYKNSKLQHKPGEVESPATHCESLPSFEEVEENKMNQVITILGIVSLCTCSVLAQGGWRKEIARLSARMDALEEAASPTCPADCHNEKIGTLDSQIAAFENRINEVELSDAPFKIVGCLLDTRPISTQQSCEKAYDGDLTTEFASNAEFDTSFVVFFEKAVVVTKVTFRPIESLSKKIKTLYITTLDYGDELVTFQNLDDGTEEEVIPLQKPLVGDIIIIYIKDLVDGSEPSNLGWKEISFA